MTGPFSLPGNQPGALAEACLDGIEHRGGRVPIAVGIRVPLTPRRAGKGGADALRVRAGKYVPAQVYRLRPFRLFAQRDTGRLQQVGLFLEPARVGDHHPRLIGQRHQLSVAKRLNRADVRRKLDAQTAHRGARPWMHWEDRWTGIAKRAEDRPQRFGGVGVRRAMDGQQAVRAGLQPQLAKDCLGCGRVLADAVERVNHDVPYARCALSQTLAPEVVHRGFVRRQKQVGAVVHEHPVDFFRHGAVEAAQAGFDVGNRYLELRCGQRAGQRRVRVAEDRHQVWPPRQDFALDTFQGARRHFAMRPRPDAKVHVRLGDVQLAKEARRHAIVVVLARVHQRLAMAAPARLSRKRRKLDELRARTNDGEDVHGYRVRRRRLPGKTAAPIALTKSGGGHSVTLVYRNGIPRLDDEDLALPNRPLVSIVIPTLNEEAYITALLDSLARQDYGPDAIEVLVADGGSTDRTRSLVMGYQGPFDRLLLIDNPKVRATAGFNAGMRVARGDCWIIIGAHSEVREDFVRASVEALKRTGAACVGGPIETLGKTPTGRAIAAAMSSPFGVGGAKFRWSEREEEVDTVAFGCYHRRVWEVAGEFDEDVDGGDDDEYNARVREVGGRFVLVPAIRSRYYARESLRALAKQYWEYGMAKGTQLRHGYSLRPRHFVPGMMVAGGPSLFLAGIRSKLARRALGLLATAYVVIGGRSAWRAARKKGANPALTFVAMATMHVSYGAGFLWAAWRER